MAAAGGWPALAGQRFLEIADRLDRHWRGEDVALNQVGAIVFVEQRKLLARLDAFHHDAQIEFPRQVDRAAQKLEATRVLTDVADEGPVDLDDVKRQLVEIAEA